jgi:hypothetical protein
MYFSNSQMFHNGCELLSLKLGLGPAFFIYITFLFDTSVGFVLALTHSRWAWGDVVVKALYY